MVGDSWPERVVGQLGHVDDGVDAVEVLGGEVPDVLGERERGGRPAPLYSQPFL